MINTKLENNAECDVQNIYKLDGRVPVLKAIPFGLQHVLAMFVANVAPLMIIANLAVYNGQAFTQVEITQLIQNCMLIAGIGTLIQLYPIWKIGSRLPIVMGLSFTFLSACIVAVTKDYGYMIGGVIIGGVIEGVIGLFYRYIKWLFKPIVAACVVTAIGFSLFNVGVSSFCKSNAYDTGAWQNLVVGMISLIACLVCSIVAKGILKSLSVLVGLIVGYIAAICFGMVDFQAMADTVSKMGVVSFPRMFAYVPKFDIGIIVSFVIVFLVSAVETMGDTTAACEGGLGREPQDKEIGGSLAVDGLVSALAGGVFGLSPITSFSQNAGLLKMTKVVNRFTIMFGALILILSGLFPPISAFFSSLPDCVLGGCTIMMFGSIFVAGIEMIIKNGANRRNAIIVSISLCVGIGVTQVDGFFSYMPEFVSDIFKDNIVAGVFVVAFILSLVLPKSLENEAD